MSLHLRVGFASLLLVVAAFGCGSTACPGPEPMAQDEVLRVVQNETNETDFDACMQGSCLGLCNDAVTARNIGGPVRVDVCERVEADGGVVGSDGGSSNDVALHIVFRAFPFCGT
jgi:hypothetical protein